MIDCFAGATTTTTKQKKKPIWPGLFSLARVIVLSPAIIDIDRAREKEAAVVIVGRQLPTHTLFLSLTHLLRHANAQIGPRRRATCSFGSFVLSIGRHTLTNTIRPGFAQVLFVLALFLGLPRAREERASYHCSSWLWEAPTRLPDRVPGCGCGFGPG